MENKCPRCQKGSIDHAREEWWSLDLPPRVIDFLKKTRYSAMCRSCIDILISHIEYISDRPLPGSGELVEGEHYTIGEGRVVFTELYHIWKGYCCGHACRHCAYRQW